MREGRPSATALRVALRRAAHQILDHPKVFDDPLAVPILGPEAARLHSPPSNLETPVSGRIRAFMAARARFAEDELARAFALGASQCVVLGAGLDTFAYRNPFAASGLRVFEVDHPATQSWKRRLLDEAAIPIPPSVTFAPLDFESQTLAAALEIAAFDPAQITFFSWLGVVPYLTREALMATLRFIASLPPHSGVVFDYALPRASLPWKSKIVHDVLAARVASAGEPFHLFLDPAALAQELTAMGFGDIDDLDSDEINTRYFSNRSDGLRVGGGLAHLISARVRSKDR